MRIQATRRIIFFRRTYVRFEKHVSSSGSDGGDNIDPLVTNVSCERLSDGQTTCELAKPDLHDQTVVRCVNLPGNVIAGIMYGSQYPANPTDESSNVQKTDAIADGPNSWDVFSITGYSSEYSRSEAEQDAAALADKKCASTNFSANRRSDWVYRRSGYGSIFATALFSCDGTP